ncbi:phage BR0599 family protein [Rhizobium nepotum]|uniref:phage BR0599 family protein n=1 Tax=Rhizobium nepotum TaxID=1035271 RepID=UPI003CEE8EE4
MSYDSLERSNASALPIALYEFTFGTAFWRYSSDEEDTDLNGVNYPALPISDSGVEQSGDASSDEMTVTMPKGEQVAIMLNGQPPSEKIWLTLRRKHRGEDDAPIIWVGYVVSCKQTNTVSVEISCKMLTAGFDRNGLRLSWGRQCPHALYDMSCRVNKNLHAISFQIDAIEGNAVISSDLLALPSGYLSNGFFEWPRYPGAVERRGIENHSGGKFIILGTGVGLSAGDWVTAYPGCSRTRNDCKNKFNNLGNFGGCPHMPGKSPFQGDPVF